MSKKKKHREKTNGTETTPVPEDKIEQTEAAAAPAEEKAPETEEAPAEEKAPETEEAPAEEKAPETEEAPAEEKAPETEEAPAEEKDEKVYELREEKNPELEPVIVERNPDATIQFSKSYEREKKIADEVRRRRRRPIVFVLSLCVLLVLTAIVVNAIDSGGFRMPSRVKETPVPENPDAQVTMVPIPTAPLATEAPVETEEPVKESVYNIILSDMSWEEAKQDCIAKGGHLATVSSYEELLKITARAEEMGVYNLWIGCARVNGELVWENGESIDYYAWGVGEPSYYDGFDGAAEDYVMLWNYDGVWCYNDSRNDPAGEYAYAYSGKIAYVLETEG